METQVSFELLVTAILYSLALNGMTEAVKACKNDQNWTKRFMPTVPVVLGGISGPLIWPALFEIAGTGIDPDITFSVFMGIGAGCCSGMIYKFVKHTVFGET